MRNIRKDMAKSALYDRVPVDALLTEHGEAVGALRGLIGDALPSAQVDGVEFDDIFLLRYILSHKTAARAVTALRETLVWRAKHADILAAVNAEGKPAIPNYATFIKFQTVGDVDATFGGWPTFVVRTAHSDLPSLMNALSVDEVADCLTFAKELQWRECDRLTRDTGILTKSISCIDMNAFSFFGADRRFFQALGASSKTSAIVYPQLLGATAAVNIPSFLHIIMGTFGRLMPQSAIDKQRFCGARNTETEDPSKCPFLRMFGGADGGALAEGAPLPRHPGLPAFLGGAEECPAYLQPVKERANRMVKVTVGARSSKTVDIPFTAELMMGVPFPATVKYEILVAGFGVGVGATMNTATPGGEPCIAPRKMKADEGLIEGTFTVDRPGTLRVEFDNTYSFLRSKTAQYHFEIDTGDSVVAGGGAAAAQAARAMKVTSAAP